MSHAFHTAIVAPASEPLRAGPAAARRCSPPTLPIVANVDGEFYPTGPGVEDADARHPRPPGRLAGAVRQGPRDALRRRARACSSRSGPKRALQGFADDVLGERRRRRPLHQPPEGRATSSSFNQALCGLYAAGLGVGRAEQPTRACRGRPSPPPIAAAAPAPRVRAAPRAPRRPRRAHGRATASSAACSPTCSSGGHGAAAAASATPPTTASRSSSPARRSACPAPSASSTTTTSRRILHGEQLIDVIPATVAPARCSTSTSRGWSRATTAAATSRRSTRPPT